MEISLTEYMKSKNKKHWVLELLIAIEKREAPELEILLKDILESQESFDDYIHGLVFNSSYTALQVAYIFAIMQEYQYDNIDLYDHESLTTFQSKIQAYAHCVLSEQLPYVIKSIFDIDVDDNGSIESFFNDKEI